MKPFTARVERFPGTGTWTYATVPFDCEKIFGAKGRIRVKAMINGIKTEAALMPHGNGRHFIILTKTIRDKTGIREGDTIGVELAKDETSRTVQVPAELVNAFKKNKVAQRYFDSLAPSHQREYVKWIEEAKKEETRNGRIAKTIEKLREQKKLK